MLDFKQNKYYLINSSWENDADNYQEHTTQFDSLIDITLIIKLLGLFQSENSYNTGFNKTYGNCNYIDKESLFDSMWDVVKETPTSLKESIVNKYIKKLFNDSFYENIDNIQRDDNTSDKDIEKSEKLVIEFVDNFIDYVKDNFLGYSEYYTTRVFENPKVIFITQELKYDKVKIK